MALNKGDIAASDGMAKAIYDRLREVFEPAMAAGADVEQVHRLWQKLSYAIASGVIDHIVTNMEIKGITTMGGTDTFTQNNDGTGHVE